MKLGMPASVMMDWEPERFYKEESKDAKEAVFL